MAGVTLNQIANKVVLEQGEHTGDDAFITQCETWLKSAIVEIDSEGNFKIFKKPISIVTVAGTALYELPEDFRAIKFLRHIDTDQEIDYINPKALVLYGVDLEQQGKPRNHWITDPVINASNEFRQRVKFHPVPNEVFNIDGEYYFDVINLASGSFIPISQQSLLCLESRLRMYITKADKDWTAYNVERSEYSKHKDALLKQEQNKPSRNLIARPTDLPPRYRRGRFRYPFEG